MKAGDSFTSQVCTDDWMGTQESVTVTIISVTSDRVTYEIEGKRYATSRATFEYQYGKVTP